MLSGTSGAGVLQIPQTRPPDGCHTYLHDSESAFSQPGVGLASAGEHLGQVLHADALMETSEQPVGAAHDHFEMQADMESREL